MRINQNITRPFGEIGVSYFDFEKTQKPPEHYIVLARSVSGQHSGNLSKHGPRKTYLFYRHINQTEKPVTAISLIDLNNGEEVKKKIKLKYICETIFQFKNILYSATVRI